jgi:proteasome lid subunit RPN8/RPN11
LLATVDQGAAWRAVRFYPGRNADASRTRYTMDPADVLAALVDIERHGWRFGAIVHSHPTSPPSPSPTDLREAFYPDALMVIVSLRGPTPEARAWWVGGAEPTVVPIRQSP